MNPAAAALTELTRAPLVRFSLLALSLHISQADCLFE
jgi:hypothetical protein